MSNRITITTQAEWNALPEQFSDLTYLDIKSAPEIWLTVNTAPKNAVVVARESSHVEAWGSSHVEARESSHVVARESSHVVARESSHVVAWESSHVVAWGSSHVEAWGSSALHHRSGMAPSLYGQSVCFAFPRAATPIKHSGATIIDVKSPKDNVAWLDANGVLAVDEHVILYKRVSKDLLTQEGQPWVTAWTIGAVKEHDSWQPDTSECGAGKFHACSRPYFCDEFRSIAGDRYIALQIAVADLYCWPDAEYPHKIAFRKATVLHECDRYGKELLS